MFLRKFELRGRILQYFASFLVSTFTASTFMALLWTSSVNQLFTSDKSPFGQPANSKELGSLYILLLAGSIVGNLCLGVMINKAGRKGSLLIMCIPNFISWSMILFGRQFFILQIARFIMGLTLSIPIAISSIYIAEIAESSVRGKLSIIGLVFAETGAILTLAVGPKSYIILASIGVAIPVIVFIITIFMPETPYFYLKEKKLKEAEASLKRLRDTDDVKEELQLMTLDVEEDLKNKGKIKDIFQNKSYRKAFFIVFGLRTCQELTGSTFINGIMTELFVEADTGLDINTESLIAICVPVPFMFLISYLIDKYGRKPLLYTSSIGSFIAMSIESVYFFLANTGTTSKLFIYFPIIGLFLNYIFKAMGIGNIPFLIMSELFPTNIKGIASAMIMVYGAILGTSLSFGLFAVMYNIGMGAIFLIFAVCCVLTLLFTIFFVPETKGKSLAEIHKNI